MHNEFTYETRSYSPSFKSGIMSEIKREAFCAKLHKSKSSPQHLGSEACTAALLSLSPKNTCLGSQNPFCVLISQLQAWRRKRGQENSTTGLLSCLAHSKENQDYSGIWSRIFQKWAHFQSIRTSGRVF